MIIYNETFIKIRDMLKPIIIVFIKEQIKKYGKCYETPEKDIHKHIKQLKGKEPNKFRLIDFDDYSTIPWSDEVEMVIGDMFWGSLKRKDDGIVLLGEAEDY